MIEQCGICGGENAVEVVEDVRGFDHVRVGAKHWHCSECQSDFVTGSQLKYNSQCQVIEIEGPFKPIEISHVHNMSVYFDWSWAGRGFGQLSFSGRGAKIKCSNECMSRESVRELLHAFADHIADTMELEDE